MSQFADLSMSQFINQQIIGIILIIADIILVIVGMLLVYGFPL